MGLTYMHVRISPHASCLVFWKWSYAKLLSVKDTNVRHLEPSLLPPNKKVLAIYRLSYQTRDGKDMLSLLKMYVCRVSLVAGQGKMTCMSKNQHAKVTSVPPPCFWFDNHDKKRLFLPFCWRKLYLKNATNIVVFDSLLAPCRVTFRRRDNLLLVEWRSY